MTIMKLFAAVAVACILAGYSAAGADEGDGPLKISKEARYLAESVAASAGLIRDITSSGTYSAKYMTSVTREAQSENYEWTFDTAAGAQRFSFHYVEDTMLTRGVTGEEERRKVLSACDCKVSWVEGTLREQRGNGFSIRRQASPPTLLPFGHDPRIISFAIGGSSNEALAGLLNPDMIKTVGRAEAEVVQKKGATWVLEVTWYDVSGTRLLRQQYEIATDKGFVISRARAWTSNESDPSIEWDNGNIVEVKPGIWLATSVRRTRRSPEDKEPFVATTTLSNVSVNNGLSAKDLSLVIPKGARVRDEIIGLDYVMPKESLDSLDLDVIARDMAAKLKEQSTADLAKNRRAERVEKPVAQGLPASYPWMWIGVVAAIILVIVGICILRVFRRKTAA